jgi:signal transduction histidine kinase
MIIVGLLFALIAGLVLFALLTGRLRKLAINMDAFKRGDTIEPVKPLIHKNHKSSDEIERLSIIFNEMAARIETQMKELKESDNLRRELVANVSHDLRTPLATLHGYLETLLIKENQYSMQERRQYLEIAIRQCTRLTRLVSELLELARLESARMKIKPEEFNLQELVQDVVLKFSFRAEEKQIKFITHFGQTLPFVYADIALIERVLENLIENALHYTSEKGCVSIDISLSDDVIVKIQDTGPGISKEEVSHIFKRFYHSDKARKETGDHSGLGLAITQKILELHNKKIEVYTTPESGSCFTFFLPATMYL